MRLVLSQIFPILKPGENSLSVIMILPDWLVSCHPTALIVSVVTITIYTTLLDMQLPYCIIQLPYMP